MADPCPKCGRDLNLVGRVHNCTPSSRGGVEADTQRRSKGIPATRVVQKAANSLSARDRRQNLGRAAGNSDAQDTGAGVASGPREATPSSDAARTATVRKPKSPQPPSPKTSTAAPETFKHKVGRPRIEDVGKTLRSTKPWAALGMSRSTWYSRQAENRSGK